ncbi:MAG: hypothetical protein KKF44_11370, partial [Nanoarchaeota archaeon]|nr:hypothetical protein [Nanoarchaeota archaeon]
MARILFSMAGMGMGHVTKSSVIIDYLIKKGHVLLLSSFGKGFEYLKERYDNVIDVEGYYITY